MLYIDFNAHDTPSQPHLRFRHIHDQVLRPVLQGVQGLRDQIPQARDGEGGSDECGGRRRPTRRRAVRRDRVQQQRQAMQEPVDKDVSRGDYLSRRGKGRKTERNSLQANCDRGYNFRNRSAHVIHIAESEEQHVQINGDLATSRYFLRAN